MVRDGGGIQPDIEVKSDSMTNIVAFLMYADSAEVMLDYVVNYVNTHPTIAPAKDFHLTDSDFEKIKTILHRILFLTNSKILLYSNFSKKHKQ